MKVPIVCMTDDCSQRGSLVNMVSQISPPDLDMFYEAFMKPDPEDFCPACGQLGIAGDPETEYAWEEAYLTDDEQSAWTDFLWQQRGP